MSFAPFTKFPVFALLSCSILLAACDGDDDDNNNAPEPEETPPAATLSFRVSMTNLTANQPLSPLAVVAHSEGWSPYNVGSPVSTELELLAEAGDNSDFISDAEASDEVFIAASGDGVFAPGGVSEVDIEFSEPESGTIHLSVVSMLVNTNDALTAAANLDLSEFEVGDSQSWNLITYDSGTEANSETAASIPGPAAEGEGFNEARDDIRDALHAHPGVITSADGLEGSVLDASHRWDNPSSRLVIERLQ